jgi:hypothetical protein
MSKKSRPAKSSTGTVKLFPQVPQAFAVANKSSDKAGKTGSAGFYLDHPNRPRSGTGEVFNSVK